MDITELERVVIPELEALGFECVKCEVAGRGGSRIVRLYIDKPGGVSIKDCASVSRSLSLVLDRMDPFPSRYLLEVSSPGCNRPLTRESHFTKYTGRAARVQWMNVEEGKKTYTGNIRSCINDVLVLDTPEGEHRIKLSEILRANLIDERYEINKKMKHSKRKKGEAK